MRYVFVSYNYSPEFDSPEVWFNRTRGYSEILEALSERNTVINVKEILFEGNCLHNGVQYHFVNFYRKNNYFPRNLNRYVRNLKPDIVLVQGLHHPLQLMQLRFLLNKSVRIIAQHHAEKPFTGIKKYVQKLADRSVDAYLFASKAMGEDWVKKGNLSTLRKIHEVMEVSSIFYPIEKNVAKLRTGTTGEPVFLWVGRLNENKDPLNVVRAFLRYAVINQSARLYMIYHTDELSGKIKELLAASPVSQAVVSVGKVQHDEMLYWYNSTDFFLSGSHYEGSGTALCEAMSCGCVPIVTDIDSFRMITNNGNCGMLYKTGDENALFSVLTQVEKLNIDSLKAKSMKYFHRNLSFTAIASRIDQVVASL